MVRYRRNFVPGGTFFFTLTLDDRRSSVLVNYVALLRAAFRETRNERPFTIDAIVILPDHLHTILTLPPGDPDFSNRLRRIKGRFTRSIVAAGVPVSSDHRGEYSLGKSASGNTPFVTIGISNACVDYIHYNPVKHRLVSTPSEWPFSSLHRYIRAGILAQDWGGNGPADNGNFGERGG
jgi:putative transposase